jgi:hypothetical protein
VFRNGLVQPQANFSGNANIKGPPNLLYVPGQIGSAVSAVPSCTTGDAFNEAIVGCDAPTNFSCGVQSANAVDMTANPTNATIDGVQCLTHQGDNNDLSNSSGQDYLGFDVQLGDPSAYPFQILAGSNNPMVNAGLPLGTPITSSPSIVSLPIYDSDAVTTLAGNTTATVTFIGFLQVFINAVDNKGNINVTVLNVAGCGNGTTPPGNAVAGTSPVPIRLITPP